MFRTFRLLIVLLLTGVCGYASEGGPMSALDIMKRVSEHARTYNKTVDEYKAKLYIKGVLDVQKKNILFRYIPTLFKLEKGVNQYITESYSDLHYTAPNIYDQKLVSEYSTIPKNKFQAEVIDYFHVNIYSTAMVKERLLSPLSVDAKKYYTYSIDSTFYRKGLLSYKVRFIPKSKSDRLIGGYMVVTDSVWSVREIRFSGHSSLLWFENLIRMGEVGEADELLPQDFEYRVKFRFLGNVILGEYLASYDYTHIVRTGIRRKSKRKHTHDLSDSFTLKCDTNTWKRGRGYIDSIRPYPLDAQEWNIYYAWEERRKDTSAIKAPNRAKKFFRKTQDVFFSDLSFDVPKLGKLKFSPLINPFLLSYSKKKGFAWRQDLKLTKSFHKNRSVVAACRLGYNFRYKEFYWTLSSRWNYCPEKLGQFYVGIGNGQRIYSSEMLHALKQLPDSLVNFNQMYLGHFKNLHFELYHTREFVNGLEIQCGVDVNRRTAVDLPDFAKEGSNLQVPGAFRKRFRRVYVSFAPRIKIKYTPGQYYYMNGHRKVKLYSHYPTFSLDYERGIKGVFKSTGGFERLEFDMQHQIRLKGLDYLSYRVGAGAFTNREELYFVDFKNFRRNNLPVGWKDEIGGTFHLLDGGWYNSSRVYGRAHITYEAPFILFRHLMKYTRYIQKERVYCGVLFMPHLMPYMELGYGIGTHIFDFGVFMGTENFRKVEFGCKFTFELFN